MDSVAFKRSFFVLTLALFLLEGMAPLAYAAPSAPAVPSPSLPAQPSSTVASAGPFATPIPAQTSPPTYYQQWQALAAAHDELIQKVLEYDDQSLLADSLDKLQQDVSAKFPDQDVLLSQLPAAARASLVARHQKDLDGVYSVYSKQLQTLLSQPQSADRDQKIIDARRSVLIQAVDVSYNLYFSALFQHHAVDELKNERANVGLGLSDAHFLQDLEMPGFESKVDSGILQRWYDGIDRVAACYFVDGKSPEFKEQTGDFYLQSCFSSKARAFSKNDANGLKIAAIETAFRTNPVFQTLKDEYSQKKLFSPTEFSNHLLNQARAAQIDGRFGLSAYIYTDLKNRNGADHPALLYALTLTPKQVQGIQVLRDCLIENPQLGQLVSTTRTNEEANHGFFTDLIPSAGQEAANWAGSFVGATVFTPENHDAVAKAALSKYSCLKNNPDNFDALHDALRYNPLVINLLHDKKPDSPVLLAKYLDDMDRKFLADLPDREAQLLAGKDFKPEYGNVERMLLADALLKQMVAQNPAVFDKLKSYNTPAWRCTAGLVEGFFSVENGKFLVSTKAISALVATRATLTPVGVAANLAIAGTFAYQAVSGYNAVANTLSDEQRSEALCSSVAQLAFAALQAKDALKEFSEYRAHAKEEAASLSSKTATEHQADLDAAAAAKDKLTKESDEEQPVLVEETPAGIKPIGAEPVSPALTSPTSIKARYQVVLGRVLSAAIPFLLLTGTAHASTPGATLSPEVSGALTVGVPVVAAYVIMKLRGKARAKALEAQADGSADATPADGAAGSVPASGTPKSRAGREAVGKVVSAAVKGGKAVVSAGAHAVRIGANVYDAARIQLARRASTVGDLTSEDAALMLAATEEHAASPFNKRNNIAPKQVADQDALHSLDATVQSTQRTIENTLKGTSTKRIKNLKIETAKHGKDSAGHDVQVPQAPKEYPEAQVSGSLDADGSLVVQHYGPELRVSKWNVVKSILSIVLKIHHPIMAVTDVLATLKDKKQKLVLQGTDSIPVDEITKVSGNADLDKNVKLLQKSQKALKSAQDASTKVDPQWSKFFDERTAELQAAHPDAAAQGPAAPDFDLDVYFTWKGDSATGDVVKGEIQKNADHTFAVGNGYLEVRVQVGTQYVDVLVPFENIRSIERVSPHGPSDSTPFGPEPQSDDGLASGADQPAGVSTADLLSSTDTLTLEQTAQLFETSLSSVFPDFDLVMNRLLLRPETYSLNPLKFPTFTNLQSRILIKRAFLKLSGSLSPDLLTQLGKNPAKFANFEANFKRLKADFDATDVSVGSAGSSSNPAASSGASASSTPQTAVTYVQTNVGATLIQDLGIQPSAFVGIDPFSYDVISHQHDLTSNLLGTENLGQAAIDKVIQHADSIPYSNLVEARRMVSLIQENWDYIERTKQAGTAITAQFKNEPAVLTLQGGLYYPKIQEQMRQLADALDRAITDHPDNPDHSGGPSSGQYEPPRPPVVAPMARDIDPAQVRDTYFAEIQHGLPEGQSLTIGDFAQRVDDGLLSHTRSQESTTLYPLNDYLAAKSLEELGQALSDLDAAIKKSSFDESGLKTLKAIRVPYLEALQTVFSRKINTDPASIDFHNRFAAFAEGKVQSTGLFPPAETPKAVVVSGKVGSRGNPITHLLLPTKTGDPSAYTTLVGQLSQDYDAVSQLRTDYQTLQQAYGGTVAYLKSAFEEPDVKVNYQFFDPLADHRAVNAILTDASRSHLPTEQRKMFGTLDYWSQWIADTHGAGIDLSSDALTRKDVAFIPTLLASSTDFPQLVSLYTKLFEAQKLGKNELDLQSRRDYVGRPSDITSVEYQNLKTLAALVRESYRIKMSREIESDPRTKLFFNRFADYAELHFEPFQGVPAAAKPDMYPVIFENRPYSQVLPNPPEKMSGYYIPLLGTPEFKTAVEIFKEKEPALRKSLRTDLDYVHLQYESKDGVLTRMVSDADGQDPSPLHDFDVLVELFQD